MLNYLFQIFDIPLTCILIVLSLISILFIKNVYNMFLALLTMIFLIIFIASTMLTQQIYLGEFLVISIAFVLTIVFFIFNIQNFDDNFEIDKSESKIFLNFISVLSFLLVFVVLGFNFYKINSSKRYFIDKTTEVKSVVKMDKNQVIEYDSYIENLSLLNQNRIFQKFTHIIMFYICLVVILYFFNGRQENEW